MKKKQVTLIAAEESWGKIRTNAATKSQDITVGGPVTPIRLNVDARPLSQLVRRDPARIDHRLQPDGPMSKDTAQLRPTEINQSMTIVLQSGKPMMISQAADPVTDRKIIVEVWLRFSNKLELALLMGLAACILLHCRPTPV